MTKPKHGHFAGAWLDGQIDRALITARLKSEGHAIHDIAPVLVALSSLAAARRFNHERQSVEPRPAHWQELVAAITVPATLAPADVANVRAQISRLPAGVLAYLNQLLFQAQGLGWREVLGRLGFDADATVTLRAALGTLAEGLRGVHGKPGPHPANSVGQALRELVAVLQSHSTLNSVKARELAAELLRMVEIPAPEGRSQLAELMRS
jgi:hypothetical protein